MDIDTIVKRPRTEEIQAFDALKMWRQAFGRTICMDHLKSCLEDLKRNDIVISICDYEKRLNTTDDLNRTLCMLCKQSFT